MLRLGQVVLIPVLALLGLEICTCAPGPGSEEPRTLYVHEEFAGILSDRETPWKALFFTDTPIHVITGLGMYICVNGQDRVILNLPDGPLKDSEVTRWKAKYTEHGYQILEHLCDVALVEVLEHENGGHNGGSFHQSS